MKVQPDAPATMIWLPAGETATTSNFAGDRGQSWTLERAVKHALAVMPNHDRIPWIQVDNDILGPPEIRQVASGLRAMGMFDAQVALRARSAPPT